MAKNKTQQTEENVVDFINKVDNETKRNDSFQIIEIFRKQTGLEPKLWGASIVGFGTYHYKYESGHEGDAPLAGFSPRKDAIVLYFDTSFARKEGFLQKLGKYKSSKACVYIKKLADIDIKVLKDMITASVKDVKSKYP